MKREFFKWKILSILLIIFFCTILNWCWSNEWVDSTSYIWIKDYNLYYHGNIDLTKVLLKNDDLKEILGLYQEAGDNVWFRDSLLIAEKYNQWLWANAFADDNINTLKDQWLTVSDINKTQITLPKNVNAVMVEYKITEWLISDIPMLYISQLFIPDWNAILLASYITESSKAHSYAKQMLINVQ